MRERHLHMSPAGEETLRRLYSLLESADMEGYEMNVLLHELVLVGRTPRIQVDSNNDMMKVPVGWLHALGEALAAGIDRGLITVAVPGLAPGEGLAYFHEGRKCVDVVKLVRLHFDAGGARETQPLVNYAPGRRPPA